MGHKTTKVRWAQRGTATAKVAQMDDTQAAMLRSPGLDDACAQAKTHPCREKRRFLLAPCAAAAQMVPGRGLDVPMACSIEWPPMPMKRAPVGRSAMRVRCIAENIVPSTSSTRRSSHESDSSAGLAPQTKSSTLAAEFPPPSPFAFVESL